MIAWCDGPIVGVKVDTCSAFTHHQKSEERTCECCSWTHLPYCISKVAYRGKRKRGNLTKHWNGNKVPKGNMHRNRTVVKVRLNHLHCPLGTNVLCKSRGFWRAFTVPNHRSPSSSICCFHGTKCMRFFVRILHRKHRCTWNLIKTLGNLSNSIQIKSLYCHTCAQEYWWWNS